MAEFKTGPDNRDVFPGERRCVICGISDPIMLRRCGIVGDSDDEMVRRRRTHWHVVHGAIGTHPLGILYRLFLFSGNWSGIWDGPQPASKRRLITTVMPY